MSQNTVKWSQVKRWLADLEIDPYKRIGILARGEVTHANGMLTPIMLGTVLGDDEMKGDFFRWKESCTSTKSTKGRLAMPKDVAPHVWKVVRAFARIRGLGDPVSLSRSTNLNNMTVTTVEVHRMMDLLKHELPVRETTLGAIIEALDPKRSPVKTVAKVK